MSNFNQELYWALNTGQGFQELSETLSVNPSLSQLSVTQWAALLYNLQMWLDGSLLDKNFLLTFCQEWINAIPENAAWMESLHAYHVLCLKSLLHSWMSKF